MQCFFAITADCDESLHYAMELTNGLDHRDNGVKARQLTAVGTLIIDVTGANTVTCEG